MTDQRRGREVRAHRRAGGCPAGDTDICAAAAYDRVTVAPQPLGHRGLLKPCPVLWGVFFGFFGALVGWGTGRATAWFVGGRRRYPSEGGPR